MGNWGRVSIGSGGGKLFAIIAVTYPAGSVCTCTNGTRTLNAKDTSGKVLFNVPSAGTWVVSCTNGTKTASKTVSITAERQAETVVLQYRKYLFSETDGNVGGWIARNGFTIASTYMTLDDGSAENAYCPQIDLSGFKTLYIDSQKTTGGAWEKAYISPSATNSITEGTGLNFGTSEARAVEALDVSAYNGNYYIAIWAQYTTVKIYNIYLE